MTKFAAKIDTFVGKYVIGENCGWAVVHTIFTAPMILGLLFA